MSSNRTTGRGDPQDVLFYATIHKKVISVHTYCGIITLRILDERIILYKRIPKMKDRLHTRS